jgi:hypothetical protein
VPTAQHSNMIYARKFAVLAAIAAGGFISAGFDAQGSAPVAAAAVPPASEHRVDAMPQETALRAQAEAALLAQLRKDLGDPTATLRLQSLSLTRDSGRTIEGRGRALAAFDGSAPVPLEVSVAWDLPTQRVEQAAYLVAGPATAVALDDGMRSRIADRIGARLVVEFAGQPVDFSLARVEHLAAGRDRLLVAGEGVASFGAEGDARPRFLPTAERSTGKLLTLQYELGEQLPR